MKEVQKDAIERLCKLYMEGYTGVDMMNHFGFTSKYREYIFYEGRISEELAEKIMSNPDEPPMSRQVRMSRALEELPHFTAVFRDFEKAAAHLSGLYGVSFEALRDSRMRSSVEARERVVASRRAYVEVPLRAIGRWEDE